MDTKIKKQKQKVQDENMNLNSEIAKIQSDRDVIEAESKSKEKLVKMKQNTKLFNKLIEKQLNDGDIVNVDIKKYKDKEETETESDIKSNSYGSKELKTLFSNKLKGGKRTSPQEKTEMKKSPIKKSDSKLMKCPQFDFLFTK